jgi:nicotinamide-nucleotide amidase
MAAPPTHDTAAVLAVGDELILGQTIDTNSKWLSARLAELGVRVVEHATVPDDEDALAAAMARLARSVPLLIVTGGLGPTADDLTRAALARVMGEPLVEDPELWRQITAFFAARSAAASANNRLQALRPPSAAGLRNPNGTAPGLFAPASGGTACDVFCLPGPPPEMRPMFEGEVLPRLRPTGGRVVRTLALHTFGVGESVIAEKLGPLMDRARNPLVGTTASEGVVSCRLRYEGPGSRADDAMRETERAVRAALGPIVFAGEGESLAASALSLLRAAGQRLVVVESCTGGLLGSLITEVAGSSDVFVGGWITYSNELKRACVGVPGPTLDTRGAVSEETARAMALGALEAESRRVREVGGMAAADHALAITGVAGPGGGTAEKPVGTVWICRASRTGADAPEVDARRFLFTGDRQAIRRRSAMTALAMLRMRLLGAPGVMLLREQPRA